MNQAQPSQTRFSLAAFTAFGALSIATPAYSWLLANHAQIGDSAVAVVCLTFLFIATLTFVFIGFNRDRLDPFAIVSGLFFLSYCIAPLWAPEFTWYFRGNISSLLAVSSCYVLAAFMLVAVGYHLPTGHLRPPAIISRSPAGSHAQARLYGLFLFAVGFICYALLVMRAGGPMELIAGPETRVEFAKGIGYLLHGAHFMLPGGALYLAARTAPRRGPIWIGLLPLLVAAASFTLLQNRSRVLWALLALLLVLHYRVSPIRLWKLGLYGSALFVAFVLFGFARVPSIRPLLLLSPFGVLRALLQDFGLAVETFFGVSLNRLQQAMLVFDNFPEREPYAWGTSLLAFFNPVLRLFGLEHAQLPSLGHRFYELARPDLPSWLETGFHPSLVGEMTANWPWYLALLTFPLFGFALRLFYVRLVLTRSDPVSTAIYAVVLFRVVDMVIVGVGQLLFELAVVVLPLVLVRPLLAASKHQLGTVPVRAPT